MTWRTWLIRGLILVALACVAAGVWRAQSYVSPESVRAALIDTLECLGSLTRAGLCAPVCVSGHGQPPTRASAQGRRMGQSSQPAPAQSETTRRLPTRHAAQDYPGWTGGPGQAQSVEILRQVLNGLKKLS